MISTLNGINEHFQIIEIQSKHSIFRVLIERFGSEKATLFSDEHCSVPSVLSMSKTATKKTDSYELV
jgi:hypothetical protein